MGVFFIKFLPSIHYWKGCCDENDICIIHQLSLILVDSAENRFYLYYHQQIKNAVLPAWPKSKRFTKNDACYLCLKVKNLAFWPFWGIFRLFRAHKGGQGPHKACPSILVSAGAHAWDFCPPQVYAIGVQVRLIDFCSPQVYASRV